MPQNAATAAIYFLALGQLICGMLLWNLKVHLMADCIWCSATSPFWEVVGLC